MCISLLAPRRTTRIKYASESIWLARWSGIPDIVADLLIENTAEEEIPELWCIVPQRLFNKDGTIPDPFPVEDITEDLLNSKSQYTRGIAYELHAQGERTRVDLVLPDPGNTLIDITHSGEFRGGNQVEVFESTPDQRVLMNVCMFGVVRVILRRPLEVREKRWLRLRIRPLTGAQEQRNWGARIWHCITNSMTLSYHVAGPARVPVDVMNNIANLRREIIRTSEGSGRDLGHMINHIDDLQDRLIDHGIGHRDSQVDIEDWRTRFFLWPMEPFMSMHTEGSVRIVGAQPNIIRRSVREPYPEAYYEWASGTQQLETLQDQAQQGWFSIRFTTRYVPAIHKASTIIAVIALIIAVVSVLLQIVVAE